MTRSIVTGGAGFVGSHLCDFLIARGHQVICLDNLITGKKENIAHLLRNKNFKFMKADVSKTLPALPKAQYLFHLASPASPVGYMTHSIETILTNSIGTQKLLDYCRKAKAKFLFASTSEVYGDPQVHPKKNPTGATSIPSAPAPVTTRASAWAKPWFTSTSTNSKSTAVWSASSTLTAPGSTRTTEESFLISSPRPSRDKP